jgi:hypothetical protein
MKDPKAGMLSCFKALMLYLLMLCTFFVSASVLLAQANQTMAGRMDVCGAHLLMSESSSSVITKIGDAHQCAMIKHDEDKDSISFQLENQKGQIVGLVSIKNQTWTASRFWDVGTKDAFDLAGQITSLLAQLQREGNDKCVIRDQPISDPFVEAKVVELDCGKKRIVVASFAERTAKNVQLSETLSSGSGSN